MKRQYVLRISIASTDISGAEQEQERDIVRILTHEKMEKLIVWLHAEGLTGAHVHRWLLDALQNDENEEGE